MGRSEAAGTRGVSRQGRQRSPDPVVRRPPGEPGQRHRSPVADHGCSFANQVLAQIYLFERKFADLPEDAREKGVYVQVLPKHLDEEVARAMVEGFGGVITKMTPEQAKYIGVPVEGPYKPESYKY